MYENACYIKENEDVIEKEYFSTWTHNCDEITRVVDTVLKIMLRYLWQKIC